MSIFQYVLTLELTNIKFNIGLKEKTANFYSLCPHEM